MDEDAELRAAPRLVVANRYVVDLDALIGSGGMALVYRGFDLRTRRPVAMKTLRIEYRRDHETRARFRREVRTLAFLTHRHVVKVFDLYEDEEASWAVMEYVEGRSLKEIVREQGRLTLEETASILEQTADALNYLHDHGLVHLDVKPQNLIVQPDGFVKLIDFGLAQPARTPQELIGGSTFGTVSYLAPEQASGEKVDIQTDVYALGCVVYEMLTGRTPFDAEDGAVRHDVIRAHLEEEPVPPSQVDPRGTLPPSIDPIVIGALAKQPRDRYRDAPTFAQFFRSAVDDAAEERTSRRGVAGAIDTGPLTVSTRPPVRPADAEEEAVTRRSIVPPWMRSEQTRRWLRRALIVLVLLNLLLAGLIMATRGELPPLWERPSALGEGVEARVVVGALNLRQAPGETSFVVGSLRYGARMTIAGPAEVWNGNLWWPVSATLNGEERLAYVWNGGIAPAGVGLPGAIQQRADGLRRAIEETTGWLP